MRPIRWQLALQECLFPHSGSHNGMVDGILVEHAETQPPIERREFGAALAQK
jgi:hypothetical protein